MEVELNKLILTFLNLDLFVLMFIRQPGYYLNSCKEESKKIFAHSYHVEVAMTTELVWKICTKESWHQWHQIITNEGKWFRMKKEDVLM